MITNLYQTKNHGISAVDLGKKQALFGSTTFTLRISLAWTFVPVFIFQLFILLVNAIVVAAGARQPYVELVKGAPAARSISLDYTTELAIKNPWTALKLKHFALAYSFGLMLLVNVVLTALAAHLLDTASIQTSDSRSVIQDVQFRNDSELFLDDFNPVFDIVAATTLYGGEQIPWTNHEYGLLPVKLDGLPRTSNFSFHTTSYTTAIDCKVLSTPSEFRFGLTTNGWEFKLRDRGCNFESTLVPTLELDIKDYLHTYRQSCSLQANSSRIIAVAGLNANNSTTKLTNVTAVSCITAYYNTTGLLSLSVDPAKLNHPIVNDFIPTESTLMFPRPGFGIAIETQINEGTVIDPTDDVSTTNFGRLILEYAKSLSSESYLGGSIIQKATEHLYRSIVAVSTNRFLIEPATSSEVSGIVYETEARLVVVPVVAYLIIVVLAATEVMLIWIYLYTRNNKSILYEEPRGLLGAATILRNSYLMDRVEGFGAVSADGKVATTLSNIDAAGETWIYTDWQTPSTAKLMNSKVIGTAH